MSRTEGERMGQAALAIIAGGAVARLRQIERERDSDAVWADWVERLMDLRMERELAAEMEVEL